MSRSTPIAFRMVDAFFRHLWLFLIAMIVVSSVTMTALYLRSRTFHAQALTQVVTEDVASELGVSDNNQWISPAQQNVDHFNDLLNDDLPGGFMDAALKQASLNRPINLDPVAQDPELAKLRKGLFVAPQSQTTYAIGLTWDKQDEAQKIVEAFRQQYIEEVGLEREANSIATGKFLDSQIAYYEHRMRQSEQILIDYRSQNSGELPEAQSADISQLASLTAQLDNMRISQHDANMKRQALLKRIAQVPPSSIVEQTTSESPLQTQIKDLQAKRDTMLAGNKLPTHPDVVALTEQIDELQKQIRAKVRSGAPEARGAVQTKTQQNPEYQALQDQLLDANIAQQTQQAQMKLIQQEIAQYQTRVKNIPAAQRTLTDKTRDYSLLKTQYDALLQRQQQAQLKGSLDKLAASSTLLPIGQVYAEPTTGKTKQLVMLVGSLVLGLVVGVIVIVLSEWSDRSFRYVSDTERLLGVPVLGMVPESKAVWVPRLSGGSRPRAALPAPGGHASSEAMAMTVETGK